MKTAPSTVSTTPTYYPQATSAKRSVAVVPVPTTAQHSSVKKNQKPTNASSKKPDNTMPMWVPVALIGSSIGVVAFVAWLANKKNPHLPPKLETEAEPLAEAIAETVNVPKELEPLIQEAFAYVGATHEGKELIRLAVERKVKFTIVKDKDLPPTSGGQYDPTINTIIFPERSIKNNVLFVRVLAHELAHAPEGVLFLNSIVFKPFPTLNEELTADLIARIVAQQSFQASELKVLNTIDSVFDLTPKGLVDYGNGLPYQGLPKDLPWANVSDIFQHGGFGDFSLIGEVSQEAYNLNNPKKP
jgi:hypothetical protein